MNIVPTNNNKLNLNTPNDENANKTILIVGDDCCDNENITRVQSD